MSACSAANESAGSVLFGQDPHKQEVRKHEGRKDKNFSDCHDRCGMFGSHNVRNMGGIGS